MGVYARSGPLMVIDHQYSQGLTLQGTIHYELATSVGFAWKDMGGIPFTHLHYRGA